MYHAIGCLTVPKLYILLGEHSEVSQARSFRFHACSTRILYHDRLETIENSQSTISVKTLKIFQCLLKFGLIEDNRAIYTRKNKTRLT